MEGRKKIIRENVYVNTYAIVTSTAFSVGPNLRLCHVDYLQRNVAMPCCIYDTWILMMWRAVGFHCFFIIIFPSFWPHPPKKKDHALLI